jgi:hypothetical protein
LKNSCIFRQSLVDDEEEISTKPTKKEKSNAWKKSAKPKKSKVVYKTADEIINEIGLGSSVQPIKIIDMTGPQVVFYRLKSLINRIY